MATVSRVLNKDETIAVSLDVKNRIFEIAHRLNYLPPKQRRLKVEQGTIIGIADWNLIKTGCSNTQYPSYENISRRFSKSPVHFVTLVYGQDVQVDGIIAFGTFSPEEFLFLQKQSYTILFVNSDKKDFHYDRIFIDYFNGHQQTIEYLLDKKNYQKVGYLGGHYKNENIVIGKTRHSSLVKLLEERNCYHPEYFYIGNDISKESGYLLAREAIFAKQLPPVLIIGNEDMAVGVLQAFAEEHIQVPQDIGLILYRDIHITSYDFSGFTSIKMIPDFMWETAIKMMLEKLSGTRTESMTVILPVKLSIGNT